MSNATLNDNATLNETMNDDATLNDKPTLNETMLAPSRSDRPFSIPPSIITDKRCPLELNAPLFGEHLR
jgi:hypothetical protein